MNAEIKERLEMINRGEVPEGYKKTKVGIIPEDWGVKKLGNLGDFFRGKGIPKSKILKEGIGCLTYGEIYTTYNYTFKKFKSYINEKTAQNSVFIKKNDILFASSGETLEEIGKCIAYLGKDEAYAGGDIVIFRPYDIDGELLGYLLNHDLVNRQKYKLGQGHSVVHIYDRYLKIILIPVLQKKEQQKIAQILSAWDKAIELKEKLIKEKKEQKKGLMQKLLTGELRLSGFNGEWEEVRLGDISNILRGASPRPISNPIWFDDDSSIGWVRISDVSKSNKILLKTEQFLSEEGIKKSRLVEKGNIIMSICATVGKPVYTGFDICIHDGFVVFDELSIDKEFFYYILLHKEKSWSRYGQTGSQMNLNTHIVGKEKIDIPSKLKEQKAIAQILSTADKEIELLKEEVELLKLQKKGLMQLLLTGIIRVKS